MAVREYNTTIATFPAVLMAGSMAFTPSQFFEAEPEARETPSVRLHWRSAREQTRFIPMRAGRATSSR